MLDHTTPSSANLPSSGSPRAHGNVSVPLGLLLDERLTPLERNAWMVFRARVGEDAQARQAINRELGHERTQITAVYLGR